MKHFLRPLIQAIDRSRVGAPSPGGLVSFVLTGGVILLGFTSSANAQSAQLIQFIEKPTLLLLHSHAQGFLGVDVGDLDQDRAQALHLKDTHGAEITILDHDAPAGKVDLKLHDVILQVNGQTIDGAEQVKQILHDTPPGRKLQLLVSRDGAQHAVTVQLADRRKVQEEARERLGTAGIGGEPGNTFVSSGADLPSTGGFHSPFFGSSLHVGAMVEPLTAQMADFLGVTGGVMVKSVARKSAADVAGLRPHDVILEVGGEAVVTSSDWERLLRTSEGKPVQVEIIRDRTKQLVLLQVDGKRHKS
jgi:S1-C subfamily serine protease